MKSVWEKYRLGVWGVVAAALVVLCIALVANAETARAEGIPGKGTAAAGTVAAPGTTNWSGFYVGLHGGSANYAADAVAPGTPDQDGEGWMAGGQIGFNYQAPNSILVFGGEIDLAYVDADDRVKDGTWMTQNTSLNAFGTARLRLGIAMGRWLPYVTGGLAYARLESAETCPAGATGNTWCATQRGYKDNHINNDTGHGPYHMSDAKDAFGWTMGGGVEVALTQNLSLKAEYLYADFGSQRHVLDPNFAANYNSDNPTARDRFADWDIHTIRAGLNYRF
jgi:outer membrane immunogenic protein